MNVFTDMKIPSPTRLVPLCTGLLLGLLTCTIQAGETESACPLLTTPYEASYGGSYKGWKLDAVQRLSPVTDNESANNRWHFELLADNPMGSIAHHSIFRVNKNSKDITGGLIQSDSYRHQRKVLFKKSGYDIQFDWPSQLATSTRKKRTREVPLNGGELDELNYQLALRCDLIAGKEEFSYQIAERKRVDELIFKVVGEETLVTELGELNTTVVKRIRNHNRRITTLWFAKDLDYLMVKLLQEEKKDMEAYLLLIKSLEQQPAKQDVSN